MKLSVIIVNYNVKYFLHQALMAVYQSNVDFEFDVYVVDNASVDGSCEMVATDFPQVKLIESSENLGFSKGNNLAIRKSQAEYVLLLNPDTIIREDTLQQVVDFMDNHRDAGALGVKMYDGKGEFLPESKRGFPSPSVAFFKMSGLSSLAPKSKVLGRYHLGFLDEDEIHEVDVLSGAFMLLRKKTLNEVGLLDEDYFMYGEDIDLSYRIKKGGYKNYYFPFAPIIHFKGESTKKGTLNYVLVFYRAMIIFAEKHLQDRGGKLYVLLLNIAIYLRAGLAIVSSALEKVGSFLLDAVLLVSTFIGLSWLWEHWIRAADDLHFSEHHYFINLPIYVSTWLLMNYIMGVYEKSVKIFNICVSMTIGTIAISTLYGFFPDDWRSSRAIILLTFVAGSLLMCLYRVLWSWGRGQVRELFYHLPNLIIIGSYEESKRIVDLLAEISVKRNYLGFISPNSKDVGKSSCLGEWGNIEGIISTKNVDEIIFSAKDISSLDIISQIASINKEIDFKVAAATGEVILGSHSKNTSGELLTYDAGFKINKSYQRRLKRLTDVVASLGLLLFAPIFLWFQKSQLNYLKNIFSVLIGNKTWVGYHSQAGNIEKLPTLSQGILTPVDNLFVREEDITEAFLNRQNYLYAKDYNTLIDLQTIFNSMNQLGRK